MFENVEIGLTDLDGNVIREGSIMAYMIKPNTGHFADSVGNLVKKKVVYGSVNTNNCVTSMYVGFWLVDMNEEEAYYKGNTTVPVYDCGYSIQYFVEKGGTVIGNVHENKSN